jgi:hypothetical protein
MGLWIEDCGIGGVSMIRVIVLISLTVGACRREAPRDVAADTAPADSAVRRVRPAAKPGLIELYNPLPGDQIQSPLAIEGMAKGPWYFEASFPVYLLNAAGDTIARVPAESQGEWMTENMVPFKATLEFTPPAGDSGTLIFARSNASGLPEHDDELRVPIKFH